VLSTLSGFGNVQAEAVAISRSGGWIAFALDKAIMIWDVKTKRVGQKRVAGARTVTFDDDGSVLSWSVGTEVSFSALEAK
jgi:hypothetical protein